MQVTKELIKLQPMPAESMNLCHDWYDDEKTPVMKKVGRLRVVPVSHDEMSALQFELSWLLVERIAKSKAETAARDQARAKALAEWCTTIMKQTGAVLRLIDNLQGAMLAGVPKSQLRAWVQEALK